MKKIAVFILLVAFAAPPAHSQVLIALLFGDKLTSDKFELGVRLAGNWQNLMGLGSTDARFSVGFGIYGTLKLSEGFSLQPELLFKDPRGAKGLARDVFGNPDLDPLLENASVTAKLAYVSLPVLLKYSLTPQLSVGFGPQIGYLSSARNEYVAQVYEEDDLVFKDDIKSKLNAWDFALAFNLEYRLMKKRAIQVGLRYYLGLVDIFKDNSGDSVRNSVFQVYIGIPVGGKAKDK
jgi:hypothetical protein